MTSRLRLFPSRSLDFRLLAGFVALLFLLGGGSRADLASLVIIRPLAVLAAAWWGLRMIGLPVRPDRWFLAFAAATFGLAAIHLIPLPPAVWHALPGHAIIARVDEVAGLGMRWRPLTIAPTAATNAFWSLFVPLAAGLGMIHLDLAERRKMLTVVLALAGVSLALALIQALAPSLSALWFYRITNTGSPVGLFANRNHNAVFLAAMLPLLAAWAVDRPEGRTQQAWRIAAAAAALLAAVAVLVSGSRAGVILLAVAIAGAALIVPFQRRAAPGSKELARRRRQLRIPPFAALAVAALLVLGLFVLGSQMGDTSSIGRLTDDGTGDFRPVIWRNTMALVPQYLPLGSGLGSFVEAYLVHEPTRDIMAQYVNHTHNDFLEIALTLGIPGLALVAAALLFVARRGWRAWRSPVSPEIRLARAAAAALAVLIGASAVDYPLRTPSLAATAVILLFWLALAESGDTRRRA